jgi:hypothetical protein
MPRVDDEKLLGPYTAYLFVRPSELADQTFTPHPSLAYVVIEPGPRYNEIKAMLAATADDHNRKMREAIRRDDKSFWRGVWQSSAQKAWAKDRTVLVLVQEVV